MVQTRKSYNRPEQAPEAFFAEHPVFRLEDWAAILKGPGGHRRAHEKAKYYVRTGRLARVARSLYAVVPVGTAPGQFKPDPYLVAAALRSDAILAYHSALDLLGVAHSIFHWFPYVTLGSRRLVRFRGYEWPAVRPHGALLRRRKAGFGTTFLDRRGVRLRVTGPERSLVDGLMALRWVGGLDELVESAGGFRDLDLDLLGAYLRFFDKRVLYAAVGWFLEKHPETAEAPQPFLDTLERRAAGSPIYLGSRSRGGRMQARWRLIVPAHLSLDAGFEGTGARS